jgi:exonuclease SbcD
MKLLHTADLHIGKRVRGFSLIEEQRFALDQIVEIARAQHVDAVVIAGDVYDKPVPPIEALGLLESFLSALAAIGIPVLIVAGNHDSPERLSFGAPFMHGGLVIARAFSGQPQFADIDSPGGAARVHLLPFVRPAHVRAAYPEQAADIETYDDAIAIALAHQPLRAGAANILVAHQFVVDGGTDPALCDSEDLSIGGVDKVEAGLFDAFDYVALGHIHTRQRIRRDQVRYSGSLYPYSFSEAGRAKSVAIVDVGYGRNATVDTCPLAERRTLREVQGRFADIKAAAANDPHADDYMHVTLTDEALMNAMEKVRSFHPNVMQLDFDHMHTASAEGRNSDIDAVSSKSPSELFEEYYREQAEAPLTSEQESLISALLQEEPR